MINIKKTIFRLSVDAAMTIVLLLLTAYVFIDGKRHMWLGLTEAILFIIHIFMNRKWFTGLFKCVYTPIRILQLVINAAVLASMAGLILSGFILSDGFGLARIHAGRAFARRLHMLSAYWGFAFMSLHLGMHWNMITGML